MTNLSACSSRWWIISVVTSFQPPLHAYRVVWAKQSNFFCPVKTPTVYEQPTAGTSSEYAEVMHIHYLTTYCMLRVMHIHYLTTYCVLRVMHIHYLTTYCMLRVMHIHYLTTCCMLRVMHIHYLTTYCMLRIMHIHYLTTYCTRSLFCYWSMLYLNNRWTTPFCQLVFKHLPSPSPPLVLRVPISSHAVQSLKWVC